MCQLPFYPSTEAESSRGLRAPALSTTPPQRPSRCMNCFCPPAGTGTAVLSGVSRAPAAGSSGVPPSPPEQCSAHEPHLGCLRRDPLIKGPRLPPLHMQVLPGGDSVLGQLFQGLSAELSFCWGLSSCLMTAPRLGVTGAWFFRPRSQKFPSGNGSPANPDPQA